jgi:hypothetical protein
MIIIGDKPPLPFLITRSFAIVKLRKPLLITGRMAPWKRLREIGGRG